MSDGRIPCRCALLGVALATLALGPLVPPVRGDTLGTVQVPVADVPLTLRGAVMLALDRNPELEVEKWRAAARGTLADEARAEFDAVLNAEVSHQNAQRQTTARQEALETSSAAVRRGSITAGTLEITKLYTTGSRLTVSAATDRNNSNLSSEQYQARAEARLDQPLLRDRGSEVNLVRVRIAENDAAIGRHALSAFLQDLLAGVEAAYWDLVFARWEVEVREISLDTARQLLADTSTRAEAGKLPRVELAAARAEMAAREEVLEDARAGLESARLDLVQWFNPDPTLPWRTTPLPVDFPEPVDPEPGVETAIEVAMGSRPDLLQARLELENGVLEVVETRNGLLPRLDLFASYAHSGLGTNWNESWSTVVKDRFQEWRLGLRFETALGRRAERARQRRAEFDRNQAAAAVANLQLLIEVQLRKAAVEVDRLARKVGLALSTADARREEALAEKAKFEAGRSTSSDVLQAENRLREAELAWQRTKTDARKAWSEFLRLEGRLAEAWGVELL